MVAERLHIDELKRVEKQTATLLKSWRRLQKDFAQLQEKYDRLEAQFRLAGETHATQLQEKSASHQDALNALESQWQARYDAEVMQIRQELAEANHKHQRELEEVRAEAQARVDALNNELKQEKAVKMAMIARIRGVEA